MPWVWSSPTRCLYTFLEGASYPGHMLRRLILACLTLVAAVSLASELATRNGVGAFEYIVGILLVAGLSLVSFRLFLRAFRPAANT